MEYGDLISVVVPCYNRERSIERCIQGVLLQTYENLELIVVDDASDDSSVELIEGIDDPRLRIVKHKTNKGAAAARDTGIQAAKGHLIAFQDSDDNWFPEKLDVQMTQFCTLPADYVAIFCTMIIYGRSLDQKGHKTFGARNASCEPRPGQAPKSGDLSESFLWGNFMGPPTVLLKKSAYYEAGCFDQRLRNNNDWDFNMRLSRVGKIAFIDEPLMLVYNSSDGVSKISNASAFSTLVIFNKIRRYSPETLALLPHAVAVHRHLILKNKPRLSRRFLKVGMRVSPRNPRLYARYALTYFAGVYRALIQSRQKKVEGVTHRE